MRPLAAALATTLRLRFWEWADCRAHDRAQLEKLGPFAIRICDHYEWLLHRRAGLPPSDCRPWWRFR